MLRVASYNIHSGRDLFWRNRLNEMAGVLSSLEADIIGIQEVHQNGQIGYQASYLAERLQYVYEFAPALVMADGSFGNALLTKLPVKKSHVVSLKARREPRSLLDATLHAYDCDFTVFVTHCSLDKISRQGQITQIKEAVAEKKDTPLLLLGDFNSTCATFTPLLMDCASESNQSKRPTLVSLNKRLDYIFVSSHWKLHHYNVIPAKCSDHYPLLATLELLAPPIPEQ